MADKRSAYGTASSDTDFRKTWNREEYAQRAADREAASKAESKARYEAKLAGKKWHAPVDFSTLEATSSRVSRLDVASMVGKTTMVPAGAALVEHLNSKQHLIAIGESGEVKRASVEDVRMRLRWLAHKKREKEKEDKRAFNLDLGARIKDIEEQDAKEREERRAKRREKRRAVKQEEDDWEGRLGIIA
ncbi:uncharacterized protein BHQ10_003838 [Talaromyces amestolkiae]|uniref:Uncharacterized protein n=1 Tax=Talaromyces amestolkiae TaxID=1196081 RepID=A0A364KW92_TALAM|nr:uncharacterized protein BHQ10_003838 [Talaromyces amestolkiae]RAO67826.1 hypothetical protein BHQ10_003838 [Talaromyces amestolkiae]